MSTPPVPYKTPVVDSTGLLTVPWQAWFRQLFAQVGGSNSSPLNNPMSTLGDTLYGIAAGVPTRLAGNITTTKNFLIQTGTASVSAAPTWGTISGSDLPPPSSSTLGGVNSIAALGSSWVSYIDTNGLPHQSQPAFSDISGTLGSAQMPSGVTWPTSGTVLTITPNQYGVITSGSGATATVLAPVASTAFPLVSGGVAANPSWALLTVPGGGTGLATLTSNGIPYGNGASALQVTAAGTQYQIFQAGASGVPVFGAVNLAQSAAVTGVLPNANTTAASANTASAIVARDGSGNFTAGTITASLTGHASLDLAIANNLSDVNSATTSFNNISPMTTSGDVIYGGASGAGTRLAGNTTTTKKFLTQTGNGAVSAAPAWDTIIGSDLPNPSASTLGGIQSYVAVSNQWISSISTSGVPGSTQPAFSNISGNLATAQLPTAQTWPSSGTVLACTPNQYGVLLSGSGATASVLAPDASTAKVLVSGGASANPAWALLTNTNLSGSAAITNANLATMVTATVKGNISGSTATPSDVSLVAAATASTVMFRDANINTSVNNIAESYATTATAAGTTTLTVASAKSQFFTGVTTQSVVLPDATTLPQTGFGFYIVNLSSGALTVKDAGANTVQLLAASTFAFVTAKSISTSNGSWDVQYGVNGAGGGTVTSVAASGPSGIATWSSAVTTSGTLTQSLSNQNANTVLAGPTSGSATTPAFRALVAADIPNTTPSAACFNYMKFS